MGALYNSRPAKPESDIRIGCLQHRPHLEISNVDQRWRSPVSTGLDISNVDRTGDLQCRPTLEISDVDRVWRSPATTAREISNVDQRWRSPTSTEVGDLQQRLHGRSPVSTNAGDLQRRPKLEISSYDYTGDLQRRAYWSSPAYLKRPSCPPSPHYLPIVSTTFHPPLPTSGRVSRTGTAPITIKMLRSRKPKTTSSTTPRKVQRPITKNKRYPQNKIAPRAMWSLDRLQHLYPHANLTSLSKKKIPGKIYLFEIWNGDERLWKVGRSKHPYKRSRDIRRRCAPDKQRVVAQVAVLRSSRIERLMHLEIQERGWVRVEVDCVCRQAHQELFRRDGDRPEVKAEFFDAFEYVVNK
ncbi:hypothetical protein PQX77_010370 [Marasmius sp. AFHP31]|nr:hypothetical protein PQX77_010370 [Marasmius sp. AFHP31]